MIENNQKETDIFILESGSDKKKLSKYYTWWAKDPLVKKNGLRFPRGMNFALSNLYMVSPKLVVSCAPYKC